jgi:hypothetical protein
MCRPMLEDRDDNNIGIYVIWEIHTLCVLCVLKNSAWLVEGSPFDGL